MSAKYFICVDLEAMKNKALTNAQNAVMNQVKKIDDFECNGAEKPASQKSFDTTFSLANPTMNTKKQLPQPKIFEGNLKTYQLKVCLITNLLDFLFSVCCLIIYNCIQLYNESLMIFFFFFRV